MREVLPSEKEAYNRVVNHPLQAWEWGEFREKTGVGVVRLGVFEGKKLTAGWQLTIHRLPKVDWTVGYFPKGPKPTRQMMRALTRIGRERRCLFVKLEPNVGWPVDDPKKEEEEKKLADWLKAHGCQRGRPLFTKYTFQVDLTKSEEELLAKMHPKTRYNIRLAERKGVKVVEDSTEKGFEEYLRLREETLKRQGFYDHTEEYKRLMWETLRPAGIAHLLKAVFRGKTLAAWIVFLFGEAIYYPYGASTREHREVMASNLLMWEIIRWGKRQGAKVFDMWGSLGPQPDPKDPWFGFHRFKQGYGGKLIEFVGSFDLVLEPRGYRLFRIAEALRWKWLRLKAKWQR